MLTSQTEKFYDMLGTGSFLVLSIGSMLTTKDLHPRKVKLFFAATLCSCQTPLQCAVQCEQTFLIYCRV